MNESGIILFKNELKIVSKIKGIEKIKEEINNLTKYRKEQLLLAGFMFKKIKNKHIK